MLDNKIMKKIADEAYADELQKLAKWEYAKDHKLDAGIGLEAGTSGLPYVSKYEIERKDQ